MQGAVGLPGGALVSLEKTMKHRTMLLIGVLGAFACLLPDAKAQQTTIKIGVVPGPHAQVMKVVQEVVAESGLKLEVIEYTDPAKLDSALSKSVIDANSGQNLLFLESQIRKHDFDLVNVGYTITFPLGIYSRKIRSIRSIQPGATIALPKDPQDAARALVLLHNYGLLDFPESLAERVSGYRGLPAVTPKDVIENRLSLQFVQLEPQELLAALKTATAVAMPYSVAAGFGLLPGRDSIAQEDARCPFADVLVVRTQDKDKPWVKELVKAYRSGKVANFIFTEFKNTLQTPW